MSWDAHKNFALSTIAIAPSPATSGTTLSVATGDGAIFPAAPFNVTIWPTGTQPTLDNAEIARVTSTGTGDDWTIERSKEGTTAKSITTAFSISATITVKTLTDVEALASANEAALAKIISGSFSISNGVDHESITGLGLSFTPSRVLGLSISRPSGGLNLRANDVSGTLTADGFDFELDGVTDSTDYVLNYLILP